MNRFDPSSLPICCHGRSVVWVKRFSVPSLFAADRVTSYQSQGGFVFAKERKPNCNHPKLPEMINTYQQS